MSSNSETPVKNQRFLAVEVVQTSAMDCGPAALKSILEGFGIPVSLGRLREACQTDVDGTSINTIEDLAVQLGLNAEQVMLPADHLILEEAQALPAIVVVRLPSGFTHFLVAWNRFGPWLQLMDPASGRRWVTWENFQKEIYIHTFPVPAMAWREWAGSDGFQKPLRRRMLNLKIDESEIENLFADALQDDSWRSLAALDAATRMVESIVHSHGLREGRQAGHVLERFYQLNRSGPPSEEEAHDERVYGIQHLAIPAMYWSVTPADGDVRAPEAGDETAGERLLLRGAVLVRILGERGETELTLDEGGEIKRAVLPPDLQAALKEPSYRPEREVWKALRQDGLLTPVVLTFALLVATIGVIIEALLFQGIIRLSQSLSLLSQRVGAAFVLIAFLVTWFLLEVPISDIVLRMGRRLETRLRVSLLEKIPRLGDRYFRSRLTSDMTLRAYDLRQLRTLPYLGVNLIRLGFQLILTAIGVIWLDPISAPLAIIGTVLFIVLSFLTRPVTEELDLRMRTHTGALSRFYLDALLGLVPAKTHGAERSLRRQHEMQLFEWVRAGRDYYNLSMYLQSAGQLLYSVFAILILFNYIAKGGETQGVLLLFYWTLSLPVLGQSFSNSAQQYPMLRNRVLRLLEPLGAPDEETAWEVKGDQGAVSSDQELVTSDQGLETGDDGLPVISQKSPVTFTMEDVWLNAGGHTILKEINLSVAAGEHLAIVGPSGAGKSSLVGLLLGWARPVQGSILVDGASLDGSKISQLRQETAWVDPAVQLWNRSLYENLRYGGEGVDGREVGAVVQQADLYGVLERMPDGLKSVLGESGGLVSGGEGQRVRLGRAMMRPVVRLVILDEPFRGLDREQRRDLLAGAREYWKDATLLCITHDMKETLAFSRVLVIEEGKIMEDGNPQDLAARDGTRYRALLDAEEEVREGLWQSAEWRRLWIEDGRLKES